MPTLDVMSVNLWQILASLCNLLIIFLLLKKFLYAPVKKMLDARKAAIDAEFNKAGSALEEARRERDEYERKMRSVKAEADSVVKKAAEDANRRSEEILAEAREKADAIVADAVNEAALERRKAEDEIKKEIVDVSTVLAEKVLKREVKSEDHRALIDSFIGEIGAENDGNR